MSVPGASLEAVRGIAQKAADELNKGVGHDDVRYLISALKTKLQGQVGLVPNSTAPPAKPGSKSLAKPGAQEPPEPKPETQVRRKPAAVVRGKRKALSLD